MARRSTQFNSLSSHSRPSTSRSSPCKSRSCDLKLPRPQPRSFAASSLSSCPMSSTEGSLKSLRAMASPKISSCTLKASRAAWRLAPAHSRGTGTGGQGHTRFAGGGGPGNGRRGGFAAPEAVEPPTWKLGSAAPLLDSLGSGGLQGSSLRASASGISGISSLTSRWAMDELRTLSCGMLTASSWPSSLSSRLSVPGTPELLH
mmetsp:Transcript_59487/g.132735  ORF Transcript_59487/g.132735 Transcript_59487/m.132735 type:complete len:203 (-) Transcript_59487:103-711(-)